MSGTRREIGEHPWALIGRRITTPVKQFSFWTVLLLGIVLIGYLSVWIEEGNVNDFVATKKQPFPDVAPLRLAYATAILAVAAPCVAQLMFSLNKMAVVVSFVITIVVGSLAYGLSELANSLQSIQCYGRAGLLIAVLTWWLANGEDEIFQDRTTPYAGSGGDNPLGPLPGGNAGVRT